MTLPPEPATADKIIEDCLCEIYHETQHAPNLEAWGIIAALHAAGYDITKRQEKSAFDTLPDDYETGDY